MCYDQNKACSAVRQQISSPPPKMEAAAIIKFGLSANLVATAYICTKFGMDNKNATGRHRPEMGRFVWIIQTGQGGTTHPEDMGSLEGRQCQQSHR